MEKLSEYKYKRILLKLSGEMLGGGESAGLNTEASELLAGEIAKLQKEKIEVAVVIGGGNFFRGSLANQFGMERSAADHMGMLATCINALALQGILENQHKIHTRVMTAIHMPELAEPYIRRKAIKHLKKNRVVIFAAGTGNPLFTTDTAASLRALETNCEIILKATKVDGVYNADPLKDKTARKYQSLTHMEVLSKKLKVMDSTAIAMCMDAKLPILVFKLDKPGCVLETIKTPELGTIVSV